MQLLILLIQDKLINLREPGKLPTFKRRWRNRNCQRPRLQKGSIIMPNEDRLRRADIEKLKEFAKRNRSKIFQK
jgi:hypothetical protein